MSTSRLILSELAHRWVGAVLAALGIAVGVAAVAGAPLFYRAYADRTTATLARFDEQTVAELERIDAEAAAAVAAQDRMAEADLADLDRATKRIMRDMGFNLRIVHAATDLDRLLAAEVAEPMPESYVGKLAGDPSVTKIAHLVATLRRPVEWEGKPRILTGYAAEAVQAHEAEKEPMGLTIPPGKVILGHLAGAGHEAGETVEILGETFEVLQVLGRKGVREQDLVLAVDLPAAQRLLKMPGQITEILALGCKCKTADRVEEVKAQLAAVLPEAQVLELTDIADARETQRRRVERFNADRRAELVARRAADLAAAAARRAELRRQHEARRATLGTSIAVAASVGLPVAVGLVLVWTGLLSWLNVRERRQEIGVLRALGRSAGGVRTVLLARGLIVGAVGAVVGLAVGLPVAVLLASRLFEVDGPALAVSREALLGAAVAAAIGPLAAVGAGWLPATAAVREEPAHILTEA